MNEYIHSYLCNFKACWLLLFPSFLLGYIHCTGGSIATIPNRLALYIDQIPPISTLTPDPSHLKQLQEIELFYFIYVYEDHQPYSLTFIRPPHLAQVPPHTILQSCLSSLIPKLLFKRVSQYIPAVNILYFAQFHPFCYSLLPLPFHSSLFSSIQYISLYPPPYRCYVFQYCWLPFSFPFPPPLSSIE
jgi:hypothetical protein